MPTRLIREGWLESEAINKLDATAERFYLRLLLRADDYGRYHANVTLLKSNLFPLRDDVRSADITRWLAACEKSGLVRCYSAADKPYLEIPKFGQRARADQSKFPEPPAEPSAALLPGMALSEATPAKRPASARHVSGIRPTSDGPPRTYAETKSKKQAPPASPSPQVSNRAALAQAIANVCGIAIGDLTKRNRQAFDFSLSEILAATPAVTPEEIKTRAAAYRRVMPSGCRLTPNALAKHWAACGRPASEATEITPEPANWRATLEQLFPGNAISADPERTWASVDAATRAQVIEHQKRRAA